MELLRRYFRLLGLHRRIRKAFSGYGLGGDYGAGRLVLLVIALFVVGARRLEHLRYLTHDPLVARLAGLARIPTDRTIVNWLKQFTQEALQALITLNSELLYEQLERLDLPRLTIDVDVRGYNPHFKKDPSYDPLAHLAQTGHILRLKNRPGNVHDRRGAARFLRELIHERRDRFGRSLPLEFRMDAAFFQEEILELLTREGCEYAIKVGFWKWVGLKPLIAARRHWARVNAQVSAFETALRLEPWDLTLRVVVYRKHVGHETRKHFQLDLFSPDDGHFEYLAVTTNKALAPAALWAFIAGRGAQEKTYGELKGEFAFDVVPTHHYGATPPGNTCASWPTISSAQLPAPDDRHRQASVTEAHLRLPQYAHAALPRPHCDGPGRGAPVRPCIALLQYTERYSSILKPDGNPTAPEEARSMAGRWKHKFQMYKHLQTSAPQIYAEVRTAGAELGLSDELRGRVGLTGAVSNCHGLLTDRVSRAIERGARTVINNAVLDERVRELVKDHYGDDWDAACINTCEAGLWVAFDALFSPPFTGRGRTYRARYIAPYERHLHHQGGYGRPFPPRYKDVFADRGATAGELGFSGKRLADLDAIFVRLPGAAYDCHGIKYHPAPLLSKVDTQAALGRLAEVAARHADSLAGFTSLGYDTIGYGYGTRTADGVPALQRGVGELAREYEVPYVVDNAWGLPFLGTDPRAIGADVMIFSMDKAAGAPTAGLIVGREEPMVAIRRALGIHGDRWGTTTSHGKAAYVTNDPGKEALLGVIAALEVLAEQPGLFLEGLDRLHGIVLDAFDDLPAELRAGCTVSKSVNSLAVEINYEGTWAGAGFGIPIFTIEDMYAGSHVLQVAMAQMGLVPTIAYDANIFISPGLGTTDADGRLLEDRARLVARATMRILEIVCRHAGVAAGERIPVVA